MAAAALPGVRHRTAGASVAEEAVVAAVPSATRIRTGTATGVASTSSDGLSSSSVAEVRSAAATARDRSGRHHGPFERGRAITPTRSMRAEDVGQCRGREGERGLADGVLSGERPSSFIYFPRRTATPARLWPAGVGRGGDLGHWLAQREQGAWREFASGGGGAGCKIGHDEECRGLVGCRGRLPG